MSTDTASDLLNEVPTNTPRRRAGAVIKQQVERYGAPTTVGVAACAVVAWLGVTFVSPLAEGQREINKANAEAARVNAEAVHRFSKAVEDINSTMRKMEEVLNRSIQQQQSHSELEQEHFAQTSRALQSVVAMAEETAKDFREMRDKDKGKP